MLVSILRVARRVGWQRVGESVSAKQLASRSKSFSFWIGCTFRNYQYRSLGLGCVYSFHTTEGIMLSTDSVRGRALY